MATKYYDAFNRRAAETDGAIVVGIQRARVIVDLGGSITANPDGTFTIAGCSYPAGTNTATFGASPNGTHPGIAMRPNAPNRGEVQYDPSVNLLRNNKTGRKSSLQGSPRWLTRSKVRDTGTGRIYTVINAPLD